MAYTVEAQNITKSYGKSQVLKDVSLSVEKGSVLALLGPNGAGKTTTVRILTTLTKPDSGHVYVGGYDVKREPQKVQNIIGIAGQSTTIDEKLTGLDNLMMFGRLHRLKGRDARARSMQLFEQFGLAEVHNKAVKTYSGGMKRKLDLAASLITKPSILFLDEPTTGLDPTSRTAVWDSIRELVHEGATVLLTTQYLEEADQLADDIVFINGGHVVAQGTPNQLKARLGTTSFVAVAATDNDFRKLTAVLPDRVVAIEPDKKTVSFATDSTNLEGLQDLVKQMLATHIALSDYSIQQPSLDDVFTQLTSQTRKESR
jgi:ABC-2 type transport system ATP-binding protein